MQNNTPKSLVTKSNELVEARYHFSIWETRVFTKLVSLIQPGDADFKKYKLRIKDMIHFFGVNDNDAYAKIKAVPDSLLKKVVTIPYTDEHGEERFLKTGLIAQATIPKKKEGYIELSFHPDLKPYLLQLKRKFLSYDIRNVLSISSVYSIRIYELLKQYEKIGHREFEIDTLKVILGISDKYKLYGHFKDRIIRKAQTDLKLHTDIRFTFKERKQGRKVIAVIFTIMKNTPEDGGLMPKLESAITTQEDLVKNTLLDWGIKKNTIDKYFKKYDIDNLARKVQYVINQQDIKAQKGDKIANPGAYFKSIVDDEELVDYIEKEKEKVRSRTEKRKKKKQQKADLEKQLLDLRRELDQKEQQLILSLFAEDKDFKTTTLNMVKMSKPLLYANVENLEEYYDNNPMFRAAVFAEVKKQHKNAFKTIQKEFEKPIFLLEKQLKQY